MFQATCTLIGANKKIDDSFYRDNEAKMEWIGKTSKEYRTDIDVTPAMLGTAYKRLPLSRKAR